MVHLSQLPPLTLSLSIYFPPLVPEVATLPNILHFPGGPPSRDDQEVAPQSRPVRPFIFICGEVSTHAGTAATLPIA